MRRAVLAMALVVAAGNPALAADADVAPRFAVLAAANDGGAGTRPLRYAVRDAAKLRDVLVDLGGFDSGRVSLVVQPGPRQLLDALASAQASITALPEAQRKAALLLFYYSGHAEDGHLLLGSQRLAMASVKAALKRSSAGVKLAFLDACGSGEMTRTKGVVQAPSFVIDAPPADQAQGMVIITSSAHDENSQESDDLRGSFFTHYLATGLRGDADRTEDGQITLDEAYGYAYHRTVVRTTGTRGGTQHPTYTYDLHGNGQVVLTRFGERGSLELGQGAPAGTYLVYDLDHDVVVAEVDKGRDRTHRLALAPGTYAIRMRAEDRLLLTKLTVQPGRATRLDPSAFRAIRYEDDITKGPEFIARARAEQLRVSAGARLGFQAFFDGPVRENLFHPVPLAGLAVVLENGLAPAWSVHLDWATGSARQTLSLESLEETADFRVHTGGVGLTRDLRGDRWLLAAGPRLAFVYLRRDFQGDGERPFQDLVTLSPGVSAQASLHLGGPVYFGIEGRVHYMLYAEDGDDRSLGFGELVTGLSLELP